MYHLNAIIMGFWQYCDLTLPEVNNHLAEIMQAHNCSKNNNINKGDVRILIKVFRHINYLNSVISKCPSHLLLSPFILFNVNNVIFFHIYLASHCF